MGPCGRFVTMFNVRKPERWGYRMVKSLTISFVTVHECDRQREGRYDHGT